MHPVAHEGLARRAGALRDLVLVVREDEVDAPAVQVERLAQVLHAHRRALEVPAGTAAAEGSVPLSPLRLVLLGLPQYEVPRVFLVVLVRVDAGPGADPRHVQPGQPAVLGERGDLEVDAAIGGVRVAAVDEPLHEADHLRDVCGGPGHHFRPLHPERGHVLLERADVAGGEGLEVAPRLRRELDDPVVHVRDVHDLLHPPPFVPQGPAQEVRGHERTEVPDVGATVHGRAAHVHPDLGRLLGREGFHAAGEGIVQVHL